jgi:hypothetical protein
MFMEPKIHGLIISFPTQTAISAYAVSPGFKGGPQKDVVFFCSLGLGFGPFNFPQFKGQARGPIKFNELSMFQIVLNPLGSGNFAGNREIPCDLLCFAIFKPP